MALPHTYQTRDFAPKLAARLDRAPLLFIAGGKDHLMPPSVIRSNAKKYRNSEALTETYEFPERSHFTGVEPGWEQVADYALEWATSHARTR